MLIMAMLSLQYFRHHHYKLFRTAHGLFLPIFVFSVIHFTINFYFYQVSLNTAAA